LGVALGGRGQTVLATKHFREAIRIALAYAEAYNNFGILLLKQRKFKAASIYFKKQWLKKAVAKGYKNWDNLRKDNNFNNIRNVSYNEKLIENDSI